MKNIKKIVKYILDEKYRFGINSSLGWYKKMSDEEYLKKAYHMKVGRLLDLERPKGFNEKLNWLKLHDRKDLYSILADKYLVKEFVSKTIGSEYVVKCLGVYDKPESIEWDKLPERFVIKATHDSSGAVICKDKSLLNRKKVIKQYNKIINSNYYYSCREWPYKNISPQIIIDEFLEDGTSEGGNATLRDYKFWCFNGVPQYMYCTVKDKVIYENFYDMDFHPISIDHGSPRHNPEFRKPKNFEKMVKLASDLAKASQTIFVRVDFFNVDGRIYFGEFTFYDWAGLKPFASYEQDLELGSMLKLPIDAKRIGEYQG